MLKYARHVMYPSQPWILSNASKRAMTIGKVYESSALCYLADQKIVTDMQTQHIQAPDDDQKRLIQIIKTINMYPLLTEQYKAFNGWTTQTHYQAATLPDCTCFGKNIPVLPDAIGKYNGKPVVVEIKCPSRIYTNAKRRRHLLQLMMEMKAYHCQSAIYMEYVANSHTFGIIPDREVAIFLVPFDAQLYDGIKTCFRYLDEFALQDKKSQDTPIQQRYQQNAIENLYKAMALVDIQCRNLVNTMIPLTSPKRLTPAKRSTPQTLQSRTFLRNPLKARPRRKRKNIEVQQDTKNHDLRF